MFVKTLLPYGTGPAWQLTLEALARWLDGRKAAGLFRLNPLLVAKELVLMPGATVDAFLAGVLEGWFDLRWDYHCPHCQGIPEFSSHLGNAHAEGHCPLCQVDFRNELDQNVEVTFTAAPKLATFAEGEQEKLLLDFHMAMGPGPKEKSEGTLSGLEILHRPLFHDKFSDEVLSAEESLEIRHVVDEWTI